MSGAVDGREFDIGDLITVITGILLCQDRKHPIDGVYEILNYMTGESLYTHQLPRVSDEAKPVLLALYPQLGEIEVPEFADPQDVPAYVQKLREQYGARFAVPRLNADQHERIDPLSELAEKVPPERIIIVEPGQ